MKNFKSYEASLLSSKYLRVLSKAVLGVLILSSVSVSFADGEAMAPEKEDRPPAADFFLFNGLRALGNGISRGLHKIDSRIPLPEEQGQPAQSGASSNRRVVSHMRRDDNCLLLDANQDFYPLYSAPDSEILPKTFIDPHPQTQGITINLNGLAPDALRKSRGSGMDIQNWPIVIHGPATLCGSVDIQFQAVHPNFEANRPDRVEIGPNIVLEGIRNISIVSSILTNLEITGACVGPNNFDFITSCVRLENDLRITANHRLFIKHDGPHTCRIDNKVITDLETRTQGYSKKNPLPCKFVAENTEDMPAPQPPAPTRSQQPAQQVATACCVATTTTVTQVVTQQLPRPTSFCDGPYVAPIRPTEVALNYGLHGGVVPSQALPQTVNPVTAPVPAVEAPPAVDPKTLRRKTKVDPKTLRHKQATAALRDPMINPPHRDN